MPERLLITGGTVLTLDARGGLLPAAPEGFTEAIMGAMRQNAQV